MEESSECLLCGSSLDTGPTVVVERGLPTLIIASKRRNDGLSENLELVKSVRLHIACRKKYTHWKEVAKGANFTCLDSASASNSNLRPRSPLKIFDFKKHCLFCGEYADIKKEIKKRREQRQVIHLVATLPFRKSVIDAARKRNDDLGQTVLTRLSNTIDLVAEEARYHNTCYLNFTRVRPTERPTGRPVNPEATAAFENLCNFLVNNDECQYSITELMERLSEYLPEEIECYTEKTLKSKLQARFGDNIVISSLPGKRTVISFRDVGAKILTEAWYSSKSSNMQEERRRIVETAAAIVRDDIRSAVYLTDTYPANDQLSIGSTELVPETLRIFTDGIIKKNKTGTDTTLNRKCTTINHAIIAATRPRSFLSMVQVGLAVYLHRNYASKELITLLSSIGVCSSYNEAKLFEASSILHDGNVAINEPAFLQFIFDNADYNVRTMDGLGTFHSMGGIESVTPASKVQTCESVIRLKKLPSATRMGQIGHVQLRTYSRLNHFGVRNIIIEDVHAKNENIPYASSAYNLDCLWMCGKWLGMPRNPGWSGYMEVAMEGTKSYETSRVLILPFINHDPSNLDTIYTSLLFAIDECRKRNQKTCLVTFDQPLYSKAIDIVAASGQEGELSSIVLRLGGFHLLMSFMGSVGHIMAGSGLEQLWNTVYAKNSVHHMITGHAYARSLRAHFLTQLALATIILQEAVEIDSITCNEIISLHTSLLEKTTVPDAVIDSRALITAVDNLDKALNNASKVSRTAKLWAQYFAQVKLMRLFVRAERCGDWKLHLYCIRHMLPHFHASAHLAYAKSAHLYLQQMDALEKTMDTFEYECLTTKGFFTIRRSNKLWAGVWSDMTIEQTLMRLMKTSGGLTRGRGITESVLSQWVLGMPACAALSDAIEDFCGVRSFKTDQHQELTDSRISRDNCDLDIFIKWFKEHPPFSKTQKELVSLSSGIVADNSINCDNAVQIATDAMNKMIGKNFGDITLKRRDKVLPLAAMNRGIRIEEDYVAVDTTQIFNRIICIAKTEEELANCFKYELAPFPCSLFDDISMRKTKKSSLAEVLESLVPCDDDLPSNCSTYYYVVDGGYLLHRVVWPRASTYGQICQAYVTFIQNHYGQNTTVVFDGYSDTITTKTEEHRRRSIKNISADILIIASMIATTKQDSFLGNPRNKSSFIEMLSELLRADGFNVLQAPADADVLIVQTAINVSLQGQQVAVIGEDTDLLVLIIAMSASPPEVFFVKPSTRNSPCKVYSSHKLKVALGDISDCILFLHAATGCDSTSAPFRQGKKKAFKLLIKDKDLRQDVNIFYQQNASQELIVSTGEHFLLKLYGAPTECSTLDNYRYRAYQKNVARQKINRKFDLATLPPTSEASQHHSMRVYHQVQQWLGRNLPPVECGWKMSSGHLTPITMLLPPAPDNLMHVLCCNCKVGCVKSCTCVKNGIQCSSMCGHCRGIGCTNAQECQLDDAEDSTSPDLDDQPASSDEEGIDQLSATQQDSDDEHTVP